MSLGLLSFSYAQEANVDELIKLSHQFQEEYEANQKLISEIAEERGVDETELKKHIVGKFGNILAYIDLRDTNQINLTNVDYLYNNTIPGVAVTGEGMTVYQWDGGRIEASHTELQGRVTNMETEQTPLSSHATAVAGIMMASGVSPLAKGMAPNAEVVGYDFNNNFNEISQVSAENIDFMLSNHSYGYQAGWRYGEFDPGLGIGWYWFGYPSVDEEESVMHGLYSQLDQYFDIISRNAPNHLIVKSAGNDRNDGPTSATTHATLDDDNNWVVAETFRPINCGKSGYDCIPYGGVSKNILLVGSVNPIGGNGRYNGPLSVQASSFSSFGPSDDGRIKPDVVAQGANVRAPSTNNSYIIGGGTSFSSPSVTGIAVLLQQLYHQLNDEYMNASQLKALIINTTNELGPNLGPDYQFGFGLIDAFQAANLIVDETTNNAVIIADVKGIQEKSYALRATGDGPLKATLVWIDPATNAAALPFELNNRTPILVNDLDMRIYNNFTFAEFMPWTLDPDNPSSAAVPGDNYRDNVEQILIQNPGTDTYNLTINHKNGISGISQAYALVISGAKFEGQSTEDVKLSSELQIYPNPTTDVLHISGLKNNAEIQLVNNLGQMIKSEKLMGSSLNVSSLPTGSYIIIIKDGENTSAHKFIKK